MDNDRPSVGERFRIDPGEMKDRPRIEPPRFTTDNHRHRGFLGRWLIMGIFIVVGLTVLYVIFFNDDNGENAMTPERAGTSGVDAPISLAELESRLLRLENLVQIQAQQGVEESPGHSGDTARLEDRIRQVETALIDRFNIVMNSLDTLEDQVKALEGGDSGSSRNTAGRRPTASTVSGTSASGSASAAGSGAVVKKALKKKKTTTQVSAAARVEHVVTQGETLYSISRKYGVTLDALLEKNGLSRQDTLYVGAKLIIP